MQSGSGGGMMELPQLASFAARLRSARLALGARKGEAVSQAEFVAIASRYLPEPMHQTRLSRFESGEAEPSIAEALALAVAANVSVAWLAYGLDVRLAVDGEPQPDTAALHAAELEALKARTPVPTATPRGRPASKAKNAKR